MDRATASPSRAVDARGDTEHAGSRPVAAWRKAATYALDRPGLWPAGALAQVTMLGCLPLVLAVVPLPRPSELTFMAVELLGAPALATRLLALGSILTGALILLLLIGSIGDAAVLRRFLPGDQDPRPGELLGTAGSIAVIRFLSLLPAVLALVAVGAALVGVGRDELPTAELSPSLFARLALAVAPLLAVVAVAALAGQAFAALATRRLVIGQSSIPSALLGAGRDLVARRAPAAALAVVGSVVTLGYLVFAFALLRVLWAPIAGELATGRLFPSPALPLLLGFILIWLCLVAGSGALHVWLSAWWTRFITHDALPVADLEERSATWMQRPN